MKPIIYSACFLLAGICAQAQSSMASGEELIRKNISTQSLSFIENKGQFSDENNKPLNSVFYVASGNGFMASIHDKGITYLFIKDKPDSEREKEEKPGTDIKHEAEVARVYVELSGATIDKKNIIAEEETGEYYNYYLPVCPNGITSVKSFKKITITSVYPGIDWVIYSTGINGMKYDFVVHPGADPDQVKLIYNGAISVSKKGTEEKLVIKTALGEVQEGTLMCYENGSGYKVPSQYELKKNEVSFHIADYNHEETLIIDPAMEWGTYFGGTSADGPIDIDSDGSGNWFVTGYTFSTETGTNGFPLYNPGGGAYYQTSSIPFTIGLGNCFIAKFDNWGVRKWTTFYGGSSSSEKGLALTATSSYLYVTGYTASSDFPITSGSAPTSTDAFYLKFNLSGVVQFATVFGGSGTENGNEIYVDNTGNAFIVGFTNSTNYPVNSPTYQSTIGGGIDMFITKFSSTNAMGWSTYYGGTGNDYARAITGNSTNLYITGTTSNNTFPVTTGSWGGGVSDAVILKFTTTGSRTWAAFFGGSGSDTGNGITIDAASPTYFYVAGTTTSTGSPFNTNAEQPTNAGNTDFFAAKIDAAQCTTIVWSTFYGGSGGEGSGVYDPPNILSIGGSGSDVGVYMVGATTSTNFPTVNYGASCAYNQSLSDGNQDGVIVCFSKKSVGGSGTVLWSTYYGTSGISGNWLNSGACYNDQFAVCGEFTSASFNSTSPNPNYRTVNPGLSAYSHAYVSSGDDGIITKFTTCLTANAGPDQSTCCFPATFTIGPNSTPCLSYSWMDSNTNTYTGTPITVTLSGPATFTLTVTSSTGVTCGSNTATDVMQVTQAGTNCCRLASAEPATSATTYDVFPNPGPGTFTISCDGILEGSADLKVYDVAGRIISEKKFPEFGEMQMIDLCDQPAGIYYFEMTINGKSIVRKVVKE
jgi:hypothetical protein